MHVIVRVSLNSDRYIALEFVVHSTLFLPLPLLEVFKEIDISNLGSHNMWRAGVYEKCRKTSLNEKVACCLLHGLMFLYSRAELTHPL